MTSGPGVSQQARAGGGGRAETTLPFHPSLGTTSLSSTAGEYFYGGLRVG